MGENIFILATASGFVVETESNLHMLMCSHNAFGSDHYMPIWQEFMTNAKVGDILRLPNAALIRLNPGSAYKADLMKSSRL